jgi:hypothetical protein
MPAQLTPEGPLLYNLAARNVFGGAVAQLGERLTGSQEVDGSIPFSSTKEIFKGLVTPETAGAAPFL